MSDMSKPITGITNPLLRYVSSLLDVAVCPLISMMLERDTQLQTA
jgi:hypothetical protein